MKLSSFNPFLIKQLLAVSGFFAMSAGAHADLTWNSAGPTNNWSTVAGNGNWTGGVVWTQNENAIFDATSGTPEAVSVTVANTVFNNLTFDVNGFSIAANATGSLLLANDQASTIKVTTGTTTIAESIGNNTAGASALTKTGAGTLSLGNAHGYTGTTTVSEGTLTLSGTLTSTNLVIASGATFKFVTNAQISWSVNPTGSGTFWIAADGASTRLDSGSMNAGGIDFVVDKLFAANASNTTLVFGSLAGASTGNIGQGGVFTGRTLTVGALNKNTDYAGVLGSNLSFTKVGTGTQTLSGVNAYTGSTTVIGGTLKGTQTTGTPFGGGAMSITNSTLALAPTGSGANVAVTGSTATSGNVLTYGTGATLSLDKGSQTSLTYTQGGSGGVFNRGTNGTLIISVGAIANLGNTAAGGGERLLIGATGAGVTQVNGLVSGVVAQDRGNSNAGDFVTYGATNGFARATYTSTNTFANSNTDVVNITTSGVSTGGATAAYALRVNGNTLTNTGNTLTLGGAATGVAGLILNSGTISGGVLTTPTSVATEFSIYTSGTSTISSSINTATSQAGVSVFGPGTLDLTGSTGNSFTGGLRINQSTVIANNDNQLGGSTSAINLNGGTLQTSGTVALGGAGSRSIVLTNGGANSGGTFNVTGGTTTFTSGASKVISGTGSLTKAGAGTLVLAGATANTYTGATTVNDGKLVINGNISTSLLTTVNSGGTLSGSGTLGALTVAGTGIVAPGNSPGVLNSGNYSQTSGSLSMDLNALGVGTGYDQLNVTGTITLGGALTAASGGSFVNGDLLFILANDGGDAITGIFSGMANMSTFSLGGQDWQINYTSDYTGAGLYGGTFNSGGNDIALMAIPEPNVAALLGGMGLLCLLRRRRA